jgi:RNA polymerase sigma-54 factor
MHESTISRVTSNKFVQTCWGVFELKYFFVSRIKSTDTEDRSSDEVMNLIKDIIAAENPENPFSDEEILARLNRAGIDIARRTIAKYRGILNIPPSNKRKKLNMIKTKGSL